MKNKIDYKKQGKRNRKKGSEFEREVKEDLENKGWIVSRWMNTVELPVLEEKQAIHCGNNKWIKRLEPTKGKLVPAKPHIFRGRIVNYFTGKPDFIIYRKLEWQEQAVIITLFPYEIIGVEAKKGKYLDKEEKAIFSWQLENHIFSKILIAYKKNGGIEYTEYGT